MRELQFGYAVDPTTDFGAQLELVAAADEGGVDLIAVQDHPYVPVFVDTLSLIATLSWNGTVDGITQVQNAEAARYGPGGYVPVLWVTYWSFRLMVGFGFVMLAASAWALWRSRRGGRKAFELGRWTLWFLAACIVTPFLANTFGWLFTEMGRQPWIVYGLMKTGAGISPGVSTADVAVTLVGFVLLYTVLGVIDVVLMFRAARGGLGDVGEPRPPGQPSEPSGTELVY